MPDTVPELQFEQLADELIDKIQEVGCVDREHLAGIRHIRDRLNRHLADLHDFERSGVTE